jgi:DNA-binding transcriptional MerR regulator
MAEPRPESLPSKLYFRIGEVADLVGVEPHVLRYWEREFRTIRPTKSAKGQRVYSRRDVENLMRVRELLYREGFTIAGAKKKLLHPEAAEAAETAPVDAVVDNTARTREQLLAMRGEIEAFLADLGSQGR